MRRLIVSIILIVGGNFLRFFLELGFLQWIIALKICGKYNIEGPLRKNCFRKNGCP